MIIAELHGLIHQVEPRSFQTNFCAYFACRLNIDRHILKAAGNNGRNNDTPVGIAIYDINGIFHRFVKADTFAAFRIN